MQNLGEHELELELEGELEGEQEHEFENEGEGELTGASFGEGEGELEGESHEFEGEGEGEGEGEQFLGGLIGSLLGEGEGESHELEGELELGEFEQEQFFGRIFKNVGRFVKKAAPMLKGVAKIAAPMVGTAIGGPLGGMLGKAAAGMLGEQELEQEFEFEQEHEHELEMEFELAAPSSHHEMVAELMGEVAANAQSEHEAEAMAGASTAVLMTGSDRAALRRMLPHLVRGTAILTRVLRGRPITRPAVRAVPAIVRGTVKTLRRRAARGLPITTKTTAKVMAAHTRRVLGRPSLCARAISNNVRASRIARRQGGGTRRING
jgi:hypothetical protein